MDFRVIDGTYSWRYRNRLSVEREVSVGPIRVNPYLRFEAFYDSRFTAFSRTVTMVGASFPMTKYWSLKGTLTISSIPGTVPNRRTRAVGVVISPANSGRSSVNRVLVGSTRLRLSLRVVVPARAGNGHFLSRYYERNGIVDITPWFRRAKIETCASYVVFWSCCLWRVRSSARRISWRDAPLLPRSRSINQASSASADRSMSLWTLHAETCNQLTVEVQQKGRAIQLFGLDPTTADMLKSDGPDRVRLTRPIGKESVPELEAGTVTLIVTASRPVLRGLRTVSARTTRDIAVRLDPPRISVMSTHHYINLGASEMVVYRVTPADAASGVSGGRPGIPRLSGGWSGH